MNACNCLLHLSALLRVVLKWMVIVCDQQHQQQFVEQKDIFIEFQQVLHIISILSIVVLNVSLRINYY